MDKQKPIIVYVSGAPGSGKTTLARLISEQLYIPNISSDLVHGGVAFGDPDHNRKQTLLDVFVPTMIDYASKGISFVVDQVLQAGISESDIINRLKPHADIINVHTMCTNPIERYIDRVNGSELPSVVQRRDHLLALAAPHRENLDKTAEPLQLDLPSISVNTDNGYKPSLDVILTFIRDNQK